MSEELENEAEDEAAAQREALINEINEFDDLPEFAGLVGRIDEDDDSFLDLASGTVGNTSSDEPPTNEDEELGEESEAEPKAEAEAEAAAGPPADEITQLREQNQILMEQIKAISDKVNGLRKAEPARETDLSLPIAFVNEESFSIALESPENFNAVLNQTSAATIERLFKILPAAIDNIVATQVNNHKTVDRFYDENPDFIPIASYVGQVSEEIADPAKTLAENLKATAAEVRRRLNLTKGGKVPAVPVYGQTTQTTQAKTTRPSTKSARPVTAPARSSRIGIPATKAEMSDFDKITPDLL